MIHVLYFLAKLLRSKSLLSNAVFSFYFRFQFHESKFSEVALSLYNVVMAH